MTPERLRALEWATRNLAEFGPQLVKISAEEFLSALHVAWVEHTLQALKNMGHDTECGACMEQAFTGVTTHEHSCTR